MAKLKHDNILSDDIVLFQILPRLPARSIGRFMSVCKQWHSFLTTPEFTKMHLHHVNSQNCEKLLVVSRAMACKYFRTMDCETPENGLTDIRSLPFEANNNEMSIISSLNGLVCIGINRSWLSIEYNYSDIILWSPLMGEYKTLSKGNCSSIAAMVCGLYYSSCDDDYKLLRVTQSNDAYIYSWKSDSWRKAKSRVNPLLKFWYLGSSSILLNEKLYFLAKNGTQGGSREWVYLIIRFDTKTEMFTEIATPFSKCFHLMVVRGCIHLFVIPNGDRDILELWKMDGDGEWTKVVRFCSLPCAYQPWHLLKNGNWLLHSAQKLVYVYELGPEMRKEAKEVWLRNIDGTMNILQGGIFVETIVLPLKLLKIDKRSYDPINYKTDFWVVEEKPEGELDYNDLEDMLDEEEQ